MTTRVGWLGGSFDPVHAGHLHIARAAATAFDLSVVLLVPAHAPPHKPDRVLASGADRLALLALVCRDDPRLAPNDVELVRGGTSYSYDTAVQLLEQLGDETELFSIIGADTLADLPHWHRIAELCRLVTFCPVAREGQALDASVLEDVAGAEVASRVADHTLVIELHPASSTGIRAELAAGNRPDHLPAGVWEEICRRGLYGAGGRSSTDSCGGPDVPRP